jgi:hypothetical protein
VNDTKDFFLGKNSEVVIAANISPKYRRNPNFKKFPSLTICSQVLAESSCG